MNIIRIRIQIFWKYEYHLLKYSATYIKETEDKNMNDTAFMVKKIVGLHLKYISNLTQPQLFLLFLFPLFISAQ